MFLWLILGVLLAGGLLVLLNWWANTDVASAKKSLFWLILAVCAIIGGILLLRGKGFFALLPFVFAGWRMFATKPKVGTGPKAGRANPFQSTGMTIKEAYEVLGIEEGASKDEIQAAYRKAMARNHPDKGGNDWMASKINEAKKVLLDD